jgi:hypothetical protein
MRRRASLWSVRGASGRGLLVPELPGSPYDKFPTIAGFRYVSARRVRRVKTPHLAEFRLARFLP